MKTEDVVKLARLAILLMIALVLLASVVIWSQLGERSHTRTQCLEKE
jgi:cell division protein FtsL